ncbi:cupin [Kibdelosporangium philippinense]|uniref:Cupin n=1 Tax=Kibdelosporangium philippinense TaxID=211113 RepID=A0ABS8Z307_9PSEU|nr:cupin [Kibdelosporangium philippinense]MCE7001299.1 cupin [Kibdelosporangium philippinense]
MTVQRFGIDSAQGWVQRLDQQIFLADVLNQDSGVQMSVGFGRYAKGESNPWKVSYDEVLIVTKGSFTVNGPDGDVTAGVGEVIYLCAGTDLVYSAPEDTEMVYVTYPHWLAATQESAEADRLKEWHPA